MEIRVSGYENNRPILTTYCIANEILADAVATSSEGWFSLMSELDTDKQYALVDELGEYFGLIMFFGDPGKAVISTFLQFEWKPGAKFQIRNIQELDKKLNY